MSEQSRTGVEVKVGFFPLAFLLFLCTPRIEIDETVHKRYWGTHFFELAPGRHTIKIYFRYLFMPQCGANSIDLVVTDRKACRVNYSMPPLMLAKGSLKQVSGDSHHYYVTNASNHGTAATNFVCPCCNEYVSDNDKFCFHCGEPLVEAVGFCCSKCGDDVEESWKVCPKCGESLAESE